MPRMLANLVFGSIYLVWLVCLFWDASIIGPLNWSSPEVYLFFRNLIQKPLA